MSACIFIASDYPLDEAYPSQSYPLHINLDSGTIYDGGADDNFYLRQFIDVSVYTDRKYAVSLEWNYTDGRAERIINYIKSNLHNTDIVELWHVWLMDYHEFEERPYVHRQSIYSEELSVEHIKKVNSAEIWNKPDRMYPERPSFYCLEIVR